MPLEDRIQELCAQAAEEKDPEKIALLMAELRAALREHQRDAGALAMMYRKLFDDAA